MLNQHSLEEIADIHNLLEDIKKEYIGRSEICIKDRYIYIYIYIYI